MSQRETAHASTYALNAGKTLRVSVAKSPSARRSILFGDFIFTTPDWPNPVAFHKRHAWPGREEE